MSLPVVVAFNISDDFNIIGFVDAIDESAESVNILPVANNSCELLLKLLMILI